MEKRAEPLARHAPGLGAEIDEDRLFSACARLTAAATSFSASDGPV